MIRWKWWHPKPPPVPPERTTPILAEALRRRLSKRDAVCRLGESASSAQRVVEALVIKASGGDVDAIRLVFEIELQTPLVIGAVDIDRIT
jgi:hypothetical protein